METLTNIRYFSRKEPSFGTNRGAPPSYKLHWTGGVNMELLLQLVDVTITSRNVLHNL